MSIGLDLWSLQSGLNRQGSLQEVKGSAHFADTAIVACHVIESHCLTQFIVLTELFRLFKEIQG